MEANTTMQQRFFVTVFLAGAGYWNYEKVKWTWRHPPVTAVPDFNV